MTNMGKREVVTVSAFERSSKARRRLKWTILTNLDKRLIEQLRTSKYKLTDDDIDNRTDGC